MTFLPARVHELHPGPIKGLAVTDTRFATGGSDGVVRLLAANGEHLGSGTAHTDIVNSVAINHSDKIVSGSRDRTVRIFDPIIGRSYIVGEHDHWVMSVAWSDSGSHIVSGSEDGTVGVWAPEGSSVTRYSLERPVNAVDWRGDLIAAVTGDGAVHLLDPGGTVRKTIGGAGQISWSVALSPDARRVAWTGRDRRLRIAEVAGGEPIVIDAHAAQVWSVAWDKEGDRLVTGSADGTAAIWTPDGSPLERVAAASWVRRALIRGIELLLATETGDLEVFAYNRVPARPPQPLSLPPGPESCSHWDPEVVDAGYRPRCAGCGSQEEARLCVTCGHIGCCESQLAHATKHWLDTGHPTIIPAVGGVAAWRWCYADDMYVSE